MAGIVEAYGAAPLSGRPAVERPVGLHQGGGELLRHVVADVQVHAQRRQPDGQRLQLLVGAACPEVALQHLQLLPLPGSLLTTMSPPIRSISSRVIVSPRPVPP